jgi:hypothetical protein
MSVQPRTTVAAPCGPRQLKPARKRAMEARGGAGFRRACRWLGYTTICLRRPYRQAPHTQMVDYLLSWVSHLILMCPADVAAAVLRITVRQCTNR